MRRAGSTLVNASWRFHLGDLPLSDASLGLGPEWAPVTLPHSWNALDTMEADPARHYHRGIGWYVRRVELPARGERLWVEVEAASQRASAWLAGVPIGEHAGGYTGFTLELTPERHGLAAGSRATLALRVDNRPDRDLIPSDLSDFFLYGGLTRSVWMYTTGPRRVEALRCETEIADGAGGRVALAVHGRLDEAPSAPAVVRLRLRAPDGRVVRDAQRTVENAAVAFPMEAVPDPALWSPDTPALYTVQLEVHAADDPNGAAWDAVSERIGLRTLAFPAGGPFLLNGQPLRLHGTHRHEDWAGRGSAVPDDLSRRELALIKAAGFNFIRLAHYPQASAILGACDELGLVVWEELPWCRGSIGGAPFRDQARAMLDEMIEQHAHHPCIAFWGLGNELDWESEHPDSSDAQVVAFLRELHEHAHARDPHRFTALRRFEPGAAVVDVYSPSIWSGWYRGRFEDYEAALADALARYPRLLHMEWGGDSHYGRHNVGPHLATELAHEADHAERPGTATSAAGPARASRDGDWSESYMLDLMEWHLQVQLRSRLAGNAQWVFKDFGTPLRPENPIPYVNQKGLLDRAGRPKDVYYLFQSYLSAAPMVHIESHTWPLRVGVPAAPQRVRVYSNCPRVTLYVNGVSAGERLRDGTRFPAAGLVWDVPLRGGANELHAVGTAADGSQVGDVVRQEYLVAEPGPPSACAARTQAETTADGERGVRVTVRLTDAAGVPVVDDRRRVTFGLEGDGRLLDRLGTVGGSRVVELANGEASILVVPARGATATVTIAAAGIASATIPIAAPLDDAHPDAHVGPPVED